MRNLIRFFSILILIAIAVPVSAYEIIYCGADPTDDGTIAAMHGIWNDNSIALSVPQRWKTDHVVGDVSGIATHFLIRIGTASTNSLPVGFAVYASTGTGASNPPADTPLARGYIPAYTFSQTGWYAFPFVNDATVEITNGTYYHLTFMINEDQAQPHPLAVRISENVDEASKWFPYCNGLDCEYDEPPGVGSEPTYDSSGVYGESAGWQCGLLITTASGGTGTISASGSITIGPAQ